MKLLFLLFACTAICQEPNETLQEEHTTSVSTQPQGNSVSPQETILYEASVGSLQYSSKEQQDPYPCLRPVYFGLSLSYSWLESGDDMLASSPLINGLLDVLTSNTTTSGGVGGRGFGGGLLAISDRIRLGAELGFCYYPNASLRSSGGIIEGLQWKVIFDQAYGFDLVAHLEFRPICDMFLGFKPGVQLSHQRNHVIVKNFNLNSVLPSNGSGTAPVNGNGSASTTVSTKSKFSNTKILPEVILTAGKTFPSIRSSVEIFYQHVWGNDRTSFNSRLNSRNSFGASFLVGF